MDNELKVTHLLWNWMGHVVPYQDYILASLKSGRPEKHSSHKAVVQGHINWFPSPHFCPVAPLYDRLYEVMSNKAGSAGDEQMLAGYLGKLFR